LEEESLAEEAVWEDSEAATEDLAEEVHLEAEEKVEVAELVVAKGMAIWAGTQELVPRKEATAASEMAEEREI